MKLRSCVPLLLWLPHRPTTRDRVPLPADFQQSAVAARRIPVGHEEAVERTGTLVGSVTTQTIMVAAICTLAATPAATGVRLARNAALLELSAISKADLEILFIRLCAKQIWSSEQPAQMLMRASTFARALRELADRAFPEEAGTSTRVERLLEHIERNVASAAEGGAAADARARI